jgi:hypothetical protein
MKSFSLLIFSLLLTTISGFYKKDIICNGGSLLLSNNCIPGEIDYSVRGWPIEYYWSNDTGFIVRWFLIDFFVYFVIILLTYLIYKILLHKNLRI